MANNVPTAFLLVDSPGDSSPSDLTLFNTTAGDKVGQIKHDDLCITANGVGPGFSSNLLYVDTCSDDPAQLWTISSPRATISNEDNNCITLSQDALRTNVSCSLYARCRQRDEMLTSLSSVGCPRAMHSRQCGQPAVGDLCCRLNDSPQKPAVSAHTCAHVSWHISGGKVWVPSITYHIRPPSIASCVPMKRLACPMHVDKAESTEEVRAVQRGIQECKMHLRINRLGQYDTSTDAMCRLYKCNESGNRCHAHPNHTEIQPRLMKSSSVSRVISSAV